jgi:hypothetical protein
MPAAAGVPLGGRRQCSQWPSRMYLHHRLNSSRLVVLLQQWARAECARAAQPVAPGGSSSDVAQELGQWLGTVESVQLSRALHAIESLPEASGAGSDAASAAADGQALKALLERATAELTALITAAQALPKPGRPRADNTLADVPDPAAAAAYSAHAQRYLELQKQLDTRVLALRVQVRHRVAQGGAALRQLAALDAVMEKMLGAREQRLWGTLSAHLEKRLEHLLAVHQQALVDSGQVDDPQRWRQPGGWLRSFEQDMHSLLMAEMHVRLQPVTGLLQAAGIEMTGQQE